MISVLFSLLLVVAPSFCMDTPLYVDGKATIQLQHITDLEKHGYYRGTPYTVPNRYFTPGQEDEVLFSNARLAGHIPLNKLFDIRYNGIDESEVNTVQKYDGIQEHVESYEAYMKNGDTVWCFHWNVDACKARNMWQNHFPKNNVTSAIRLFSAPDLASKLPIDPAITLEILRAIYQNTQK